jgi:hypothetical protein
MIGTELITRVERRFNRWRPQWDQPNSPRFTKVLEQKGAPTSAPFLLFDQASSLALLSRSIMPARLLPFAIASLTLASIEGGILMTGRKLNSLHGFTIGFAALLLVSGCGYNDLQRLDEEVKGAWAEVQNQYQRRADLIPNLVATV